VKYTEETGPISKIPEAQHYAIRRFLDVHSKKVMHHSQTEYELSAIVHYLLHRLEELEHRFAEEKIAVMRISEHWKLKQSEDY
jgi:hypothetical protein